jgi:hypothetical protein
MKKVIIIGTSGSLAQYVIEALHPLKNVVLTLFVRNKKRLISHAIGDCQTIEGDLVVMTYNIIKAMQQSAVKRIISISSIGICDIPI